MLQGRRAIHIQKVLRASVGTVLRVGLLNGPMGKGTVVAETEAQVELEVELAESDTPGFACHLAGRIAASEKSETGITSRCRFRNCKG